MARHVRHHFARSDPDMTPMIDVTFQLVIFFMLTLNFSNDEQSELVHLPSSELAKPAEKSIEAPITLQLTARGTVIAGGDEVPIGAVNRVLQVERDALLARNKTAADATIILRADESAQTGRVQELIEICQNSGFETYILRAKEKEG